MQPDLNVHRFCSDCRTLYLLGELLRNPRKARYYLKTGRLPLEPTNEKLARQGASTSSAALASSLTTALKSTTAEMDDEKPKDKRMPATADLEIPAKAEKLENLHASHLDASPTSAAITNASESA